MSENPDTRPRPVAMKLDFAAVSDVGRVRKDNQDSGYAGPWLLAVCDGVGGAARGDIASSTAVGQLRKLDEPPTDDPLGQVAGALHRAHDRIAELVDEDPSLNGTSTTATVGLFDGSLLSVGHIGDSRAYLARGGQLNQLTHDHTFVQTLVDEGRITEEDALTHPNRNLILKALDGIHEADVDLFQLELEPGDRLMVCSDGACGVLPPARILEVLTQGTPELAAVELVRTSLEAGSSDNVTCIVADVVVEAQAPADLAEREPLLVGAAADLRRRSRGTRGSALFRPHRTSDTGELDPVPAEVASDLPSDAHVIREDPVDPEEARYAPRPPARFTLARRLLALLVVVGLVWVAGAVAYAWSQTQYFVGEQSGQVVIFRGVNTDLPGLTLSHAYETTNVEVARLPGYLASDVGDGMDADDLSAARSIVRNLAAKMGEAPTTSGSSGSGGSSSPSSSPSASAS